ncbi:MAG: YdcF family protein [Erysipelotrichales bacterium]|nr:YdcF family protein [Erysipelotrichales bacterium]
MLDCAIVCGYPANDNGTISYILQSRIDKAVELYKQQCIGYIIVSGGAVHNQYCEAEVMKEYAVKNGVPEEKIIVEAQAKSTYHNMMYANELMKQYHLKTCYVITNSWHVIKARYYAKKFHLNFQMMACSKPQHMSYFKVICLHIYMPLQMLKMRLKGYK